VCVCVCVCVCVHSHMHVRVKICAHICVCPLNFCSLLNSSQDSVSMWSAKSLIEPNLPHGKFYEAVDQG
jgi:hypothetical protein